MSSKKFTVFIDDNYHFMDESSRYKLGEFSTEDQAVEAMKNVIDGFLIQHAKANMSADDLFSGYCQYGQSPFSPEINFSAREYATALCKELCG